MKQIVRTVCPHDCPDQCSVLATVEDGRVVDVVGDPDHPFTDGFLCGKVNRYQERVHSPERLLTPLRRTGPKGSGQFGPISWDEALEEIVHRWRGIFRTSGAEALLGYVYSGNMGLVNRNLPRALFHALGASQFLPGTVCDTTCEAGWEAAVGVTPGTDPESVGDADLILCWGANVATTNVHLVPFIDRAQKQGAQLIVIDPFRTRTAARADWHLAPRVGTDTALALGVMHLLVRDGLVDYTYLAANTVGFDALKGDVLPLYTPTRVAEITGLRPEEVERLARLYGQARAPFLRVGMGMSRNRGGGMAVRTIACLPALVGAWGKPGGGALMETASAFDFEMDVLRRSDLAARPTREINHSQLGRALTELSDPPLQALFIGSNNPAVTCPDLNRLHAGLKREDLFTVVHDTFLTDTALYADIVLPAATGFECEDLFRSYGSYYAQVGLQVLPPQGEARTNVQVVQALAERFGLTDPVFTRSVREQITTLLATGRGPTAGLDRARLIEGGPQKLTGVRVGPEMTYFYSEAMVAAGLPGLPQWEPELPEAESYGYPLRLLTGPGHFQHHTSFAGVEALQRRQGDPVCVIHPTEAAARGLRDGDPVEMHNGLGYVGLYVKVSESALPGVAVVEGQRGRGRYLSGGPLNVLVSDRLADLGAGATYQSTWVDLRPLG